MKSERISPFWVNGYQPFSAEVDDYEKIVLIPLTANTQMGMPSSIPG